MFFEALVLIDAYLEFLIGNWKSDPTEFKAL